MKANWKKFTELEDWYRWEDAVAHISLDDGLWHMSISCPNRSPSWIEIKSAWYELVPDAKNRCGAMLFPPQAQYVNLHENCFHVYELTPEETRQATKIDPKLTHSGVTPKLSN